MAVKMNLHVAFTSPDVITSTTNKLPDVPITAKGTTENEYSHITSELFVFCLMFYLLSK